MNIKLIINIVSLFFLSVLQSQYQVAMAREYRFEESARIEKAQDIPVCRDFLANLKALGNPPMVCDRKFHPKFKAFKLPKWEPVDSWKNREWIYQILDYKFQQRMRYQSDPQRIEDSRLGNIARKMDLQQEIKAGGMKLAVTTVMIEGEPTRVLRLIQKPDACDPKNPRSMTLSYYSRELYLINNDTNQVDFEANNKSVLSGYEGLANGYNPDIFIYRGKPYVAYWKDNVPPIIEVFSGYDNFCSVEYIRK